MSKSSAPHQTTTWSAEEIGFLAGGPGRAAEAVLARLLDGGLVRISREGLVTAVHQNGYGATSPLEAYVLAGLRGTARPIQQVVQVAMASHEMGSLAQSLVTRGVVRQHWSGPSNGRRGVQHVLLLATVASVPAAIVIDPRLLVLTVLLPLLAVLLRHRGRLTANGKTVLRYASGNPRSGAEQVALLGLRRGRQRSAASSTPYIAASSCGSYDWNHHSCGGTSSCSGSSCNSSSSCSSSSSSCSSSSSSSCSSSSSSSCSSSSS